MPVKRKLLSKASVRCLRQVAMRMTKIWKLLKDAGELIRMNARTDSSLCLKAESMNEATLNALITVGLSQAKMGHALGFLR